MVTTRIQPICIAPLSNERERFEILHWDGRLDNRDDLGLKLRESLRAKSGDAALALAAYERWGTDGLVHLIGDWSAVIRDRMGGTVILASDFAGVRPLYYHVRSGQVLWSSHLHSLVERTGICELDEQYVAGFLTVGGCPNRTPYKGINSVPAGHAVCVSPSGITIRRFWTLPTSDVIRYQSEHRYEEQLRSLFREAVAVRLATDSPVLAELSGGLDSSSIVSTANELVRGREVAALTTVSYVWRDSIDETFIREVEGYCGIEGIHISTHTSPLISATQAGCSMPAGFAPVRTSVAEIADRVGAKVFLTGRNGDLVMGNWFDDSVQVAAHLRQFRVGQTWKDALAWSKVLGVPIYSVLWRAFRAALPVVPLQDEIYAKQDGSYTPRSVETSLAAGLWKCTGLSKPSQLLSNSWTKALPERRKHFRALSMMLELRGLQVPEEMQHLDYTHPFAHRPLVEFLMTVPIDVLCGPGNPRRLMRRALADLWPPKLRRRRSKGLFAVPWHESLLPLVRHLLGTKHFQVVERGFIDRANFLARLERFTAGLDCNEAQLQQIVVLEFWLRNLWPTLSAGGCVQAA